MFCCARVFCRNCYGLISQNGCNAAKTRNSSRRRFRYTVCQADIATASARESFRGRYTLNYTRPLRMSVYLNSGLVYRMRVPIKNWQQYYYTTRSLKCTCHSSVHIGYSMDNQEMCIHEMFNLPFISVHIYISIHFYFYQ